MRGRACACVWDTVLVFDRNNMLEMCVCMCDFYSENKKNGHQQQQQHTLYSMRVFAHQLKHGLNVALGNFSPKIRKQKNIKFMNTLGRGINEKERNKNINSYRIAKLSSKFRPSQIWVSFLFVLFRLNAFHSFCVCRLHQSPRPPHIRKSICLPQIWFN